ncbi:MAG: 50S ribosomal protein L24 [archaeon]
MAENKFYNMALHTKSKAIASHLDEKLAKETGKRSLPIRKNDVVKVMRGGFRGKEGKVTLVDRVSGKITVEKVMRKKSDGAEIPAQIDASNVMIIDLDRTDRKRLSKGGKEKKSEKK